MCARIATVEAAWPALSALSGERNPAGFVITAVDPGLFPPEEVKRRTLNGNWGRGDKKRKKNMTPS
jgi:hypothetical protein